MVETASAVLLVSVIIAGVLATGAGDTLNDGVRSAVCLVQGPACDETWVDELRPEEPEQAFLPLGIPPGGVQNEGNRQLGRQMALERGWDGAEWECLDNLWQRESGWNHEAENPSSGAYGIPQALPPDKLATAGSDWQSNPATQITWGLDYIEDRYTTPCQAWAFWLNPDDSVPGASTHWY
ncbi:lytic transglycosylase domain-containing protein [Allonocardiopsis opalescens]|uniref:Transglycosylase-like protein with SLT domain n=1 Tax=Allonocardiopsis opalescens TaxID=1144618 RepID=A0A2T0PVD9_9ACTN|nr:lytic transglycosylase domain-containing protein [Allonocardiopsis opalescens]PRX95505.1 hypothetical protein CLV72_109114 [Allonocardiopsis opalescens]